MLANECTEKYSKSLKVTEDAAWFCCNYIYISIKPMFKIIKHWHWFMDNFQGVYQELLKRKASGLHMKSKKDL